LKPPEGAGPPSWAAWATSGKLPRLPKGWEWSGAVMFHVCRGSVEAVSLVDLYRPAYPQFGAPKVCDPFAQLRIFGSNLEGFAPLAVVAALIEARRRWVEAGGVL